MMVLTDVTQYFEVHRKLPTGEGSWRFIAPSEGRVRYYFSPRIDFLAALELARDYFGNDTQRVYVMP